MAVFDDLISVASPYLIERDLVRQQGSSWEVRQFISVDGTPVDFTGCSGYCQIKTRDGVLIYAFVSVALAAGWLTMTATPTNTLALAPGNYVYDVDVVNASARRLSLMAGQFTIVSQVTT